VTAFENLFDQFTKDKRYLDGVSAWTVQAYYAALKAWRRYGDHPLTASECKAWMIALVESVMTPGAANCFARSFNAFLSWLHANGHSPERLKVLSVAKTPSLA
jgi:hypothetical protein